MKKFTLAVLAIMLFGVVNIFAQTWTQQTSGVSTDLNSAWACADGQTVWMCGPSHVVVRTTNAGTTWTSVGGSIAAGQDLYTISAIDANICVVGSGDGTLWRTTNGGTNWAFIVPTPASVFIDVVHFFNATTGFAMGDPVGGTWKMWYTTNAGANWTTHPAPPAATGTEAGWNNSYGALDTGHIWWGTNNTKIWKGSLRGAFTSAPTTGLNSYGVWFNDANTGLAIMNNGSSSTANIKSTNGGTSWAVTSFTPSALTFALKGVPGSTFYWVGGGSTTSMVWRSTDNGTTFTSQSVSATNAVYGMTFVHQGLGWLGTATGKIFKYVDPNYTGVGNPGNETPANYKLEQNYPNPFNPTTTINYSIPSASQVSIKVYDMLGNEIMTLVNDRKNAGSYSTSFNASNLASGIYLYKIVAGSYTDTKKMTLIK